MNRRPPPRALLARLGWLAGSLLAAGLAVSGLFAALGLAEPRPAQAGAPERPAAQIGGRLALAVTVATSQLCRDSFQDAVKPVCNGQAVTYTIAVTNTGDASLTDVVVQDSLPVDALRKLALLEPIEAAGLGTFNCTPGCSPVQITQAIRSPIGDELVVTVTTQLRWAIGSLPAGQGQTIRFTGVVAGQADGTQITNRVTAISADRAAVQSTASVVRVLPLAVGQPSLAASPTWFSQDLGGTYSQDWADFNRSGVQALALGSSNGASVYRYRNGRLDRVAVENPSDPVTGQPIPAFGVAWADILNVAGETTPTLELVAVGHRDLITTTDSGGTEPLTSTGTSTLTLFATPATNYIFRYEPASDSFVVASTFTSTRQLVRVVAADLDYTTTPGKMDLVVSTNAIDTLCPVLLLRNTWTLTNPTPFRWDDQRCVSTRAAAALELGDVDGDQRPDLALGLFPNQVGIVLNRNNVFLNTDPLTPQVMVEAAISYLPYDFAFADYDRDGRLDLAAAYPLQREARLYRNLGGNPPRFELARTLRTDLFLTPLALGWGDFDGDGAPDLALTDQVPRIYFNQRAAFSDSLAVQGMPSLNQLWSLDVIRPLARAGLELALSNSDGPSMLFSAFTPHLSPTLSAVGQTPAASAAWGATGPVGLPDLVFGAAAPTLGEVGRTTLYRNQGDGTFNLAADLQDDGPVQATLADVTGDGRLDLGRGTVVENVVCQLQNQGLTVSPSDCWSTAEPPFVNHVLAWGDANMDGPLDLLVGSHGGPVLLYRNTGSGLAATPSFTLTRDLGAPSEVRAIAWADWEKSRYPGFAVAFNDGGVELYQNTRDGAFSLTQRLLISSPTSLAWANFNADPSGRPSLAVGTDGFGTQIFENTNGRLNASPVFTTQTLSRTTSVAWGDWDNDGDPDLAIGNAGDPVQVWDNQGSTPGVPRLAWAWSSQEVYSVTAVAWADATGDGFPELAVAQRGTGGRNGYYLNTTVVPTYVKTVYPSPAAAQQPFFVAVQRPGRTAPAGQGFAASEIIALPPTVTGVVPVTYSVYGPAGMALAASPRFEYSLDGGATWSTATPSVAPTVLAQAAPSGAQGFFYWDARKDLAISDEARFRIIAAPAAAPAEAMVGVSPPFRIRAVACQWPRDAVIRASTDNPPLGQAVFFTGTLSGGSGVITYTWDFGDGTPLVLGQAVQHAFTRNLDARVRLTVSGQTGAGCPENPYTAAVRVVRGGLGSNNPILFLPIVMRGGAGTTALAAPTAAPAAGQAERAADHGRRAPAAAPPALAGVEGIAGQRSFGFSCPSRDVGLTQQPTHTLLITDVTGTSLPPALSEDGLVVAFSSTGDPCGFNADRSIEVFLARREDGQVRMTQVTSSTGGILGGFNLGPTLNAAGTRLAFFSDRSLINENLRQSRLSFQIYAAEIDPATLDVLDLVRVTTDTRAANVLPAFDADGRYLAFISDSRVLDGDQTERPVPQVVRAELPYPGALGSAPITLQQITTHTTGAADLPAISPDGRSIAYLLDQKLYLWSEANPGAPVLLSSAQNLSGPSLSAPAEAPGTVRVTYQYTQSGQARVAYVAGTGQGPVELPAGEVGTPVPAGQPVIGDGGRRIGLLSTLNGQAVTVVYDVPTSRTITYTLPTPDPVTTAAFNRQGTRLAFVAGSDLYLAEYPFVTAFSVTQATKPLPAFTEDVISYTTTIVNPGPSTAEGVEIQIDLRGVGQTTPIAAVALQDNLAVSDTQRTFSGTVIEGGELGLATGAATGIFTSAVLAADYVVNWDTLAWEPERPLGKALPNYPVLTETGYLTGAAGMAGNTLLLHLDGTPAVSVNYQISGNYFYVYVQRHFLDHSAAGADPVCRENYIYNFSDGNSWAYNYCPTFESDGRFAKGIFFDGSLRLVEMPSGQPAGRAANGDNEPRSLEMWFRTTEGGALLSYQYNFCDAGGCFYDFLPTLYVGADGLLRGQLGFGCPYLTCTLPAGGQMITATTPVTDDQWHHLALVSTPDITIPVQTAPGVFADVRGSSVRLYLDGKLAGGGPVLGLVMAGPGAGNSVNSYLGYGFAEPRWPALAGAGRSGNGLYTGRLDELAFYARALDADEV
ncbi:MAG: VCBS repeat-containing protein, partial [Anaerolineales bacterium]|nr:VCBS repeat-containing protein [Anaerolineales bacterium]